MKPVCSFLIGFLITSWDSIQPKFRYCTFTLRMVCYLHSWHHPQWILACKYTWRNAWCWCSMHHRGSYEVLFHTRLQISKYRLVMRIFFLPAQQLFWLFSWQLFLSSNNWGYDLLVQIILNFEYYTLTYFYQPSYWEKVGLKTPIKKSCIP